MNTDLASQSPESLLEAFAATEYRVRVAGADFHVRLGQSDQALDDALAARPWAIVTAHNPHASPLDAASNRRRHRHLIAAADRSGTETHPAVNVDPSGTWPDEPGVLIVGAGTEEVDSLAEAFGQAAIVTGGGHRPARLRLYGDRWPTPLPAWAGRAS